MKRRGTGFLLGILISIGLLAGLALWPLPTDVMPPTPAAPPPVPVIAPVTVPDPPVPETPPAVPPETKPIEIAQPPPPPAPTAIIQPAPPASTVVKPKPEIKRADKIRKMKPAEATAARPKPEEKILQAAAAPVPPPPAITPADLETIRSVLNRLKSAFAEKDMKTVKEWLVLSSEQENSINTIFNAYKNLRIETEEARIDGNQVTSALVIASMENERGNAVLPGPAWKRLRLVLTSNNNQWHPVELAGGVFKNQDKGAADLTAPIILHSIPTYTAKAGVQTEILATITDDQSKIAKAVLHFRAQGDSNYETTPMTEGPDHAYTGRLPGSMIKANRTSMEYYIEALDAEGNDSMEGRPAAPLFIAVAPAAAR